METIAKIAICLLLAAMTITTGIAIYRLFKPKKTTKETVEMCRKQRELIDKKEEK